MTPSNTPMLQGTLDMIVLKLLSSEPTNGYDLTLRIQAITNEVLNVNAGSLYPALYRLERKGLIRATWAQTEAGRRAKVYALTASGRMHLKEQRVVGAVFRCGIDGSGERMNGCRGPCPGSRADPDAGCADNRGRGARSRSRPLNGGARLWWPARRAAYVDPLVALRAE